MVKADLLGLLLEDLMKWFFKNRYKIQKRIIAAVLLSGMLLTELSPQGESILGFLKGEVIFATQQLQQTQQELNNVQQQLNELEEEQEEVKAELSEKAEELSSLLADKEILENELAYVQASIEQATVDLGVAKEKETASYEAMKLRIQYMYENSTQNSFWDAVLNADGITDMLNRVEYVSQVHITDRDLLEGYKKQVAEVEDLKAALETNKYELVHLQEIYEKQEAEIEAKVAELKAKSSNYNTQIAAAKKKAKKLAKEIEEQNRIIAEQQAAANGSNSSSGSSANKAPNTSGGYLTDPSYNPSFTTGVSGDAVVNFALQYVGYPYKYGGNSLTNGCDCSGFVNLVFKNFGISVPRQSYAFKSVGQPVAFSNLRAGDIVVYPGHVGIYIGNGKIVEAQSTRAGITCNRSVTCSKITAIRRVL